LALLDILLPGELDGVDVACRLRDEFDIPSLFLSACSDDATLERAKRAEPLGYLLKPVDPRALRTTLQTALYVRQKAKERDVANRERALADAKLAAILRSTHDGVISVDHRGIIEVFNHGGERMFGYAADEVIGRPIEVLLPPDRPRKHEEYLAKLLERQNVSGPMTSRPHVEAVHKSGDRFPVDVCISKATHEGRVMFTASVRDVSKRRALESALLEAQKLEVLSRIAGGVAHDFNKILTAFMGYAALIKEESDPSAAVHEWADELLSAAHRARGLTQQLLLLHGRQHPQLRVENLSLRIREHESFLDRITGDTIHLEFDLDPGAGEVVLGEGHLDQILLNLLLNARDAMPEGGLIQIRTGREDTGEPGTASRVWLEVSDNGVGMDPQTLRRATELLFTTKPSGQGTGLGLYTVQQLTHAAGGTLELRSTPGAGTSVRVLLPGSTSAGREEHEPPPVPPSVQTSLLILLAEPHDTVRGATTAVLESRGHRVLAARTSPETMVLAERHRGLDLLIADVHLSYVNGIELAQRIRKYHPRIAVLLTASGRPDWIAPALEKAEGIDVLEKPYGALQLLAAVSRAIQGRVTPGAHR
jgi:PAS domain S-box-containing protein